MSYEATSMEKQTSALAAKMNTILKDERLNGALTGFSIRKSDTGEIIYSSLGDTRLRPASNLKLLTAAAALERLGPEYQFSTEIWIDGKITKNTLQGDLYIKGKGDPTLIEQDLDRFAKDLLAKGIQKINGNIIADDSWYDDIRLSQDLNWSDESFYWGSEVSALTLSPNKDYDAGTVMIEVKPASKDGRQAQISLLPKTDFVKIINQTKTVKEDGTKKIEIERKHGSNIIIVKGTIPVHSKNEKSWIAVSEPTKYVLHVFHKVLEENGIEFSTDTKLTKGITPVDATLLCVKKSIPLKELIIPFMKFSNNGHGEILTKEMGKIYYGEGSWEKGLQVIKETMNSFGVNDKTMILRDGSGISHQNMIPANDLSQLLYAVQQKNWFPVFENSLPVGGMKDRLIGGTLKSRFTEESFKGKVKAKTGTIGGVSTLSGYVITKSGERLIFSIMFNNFLGESNSIKLLEDEIVKTLAAL